jgi:mannitol-1-phosphate/altronate dehydrogenase
VDPADQAFDSSAEVARRHAAAAREDAVAFLEFDAVFPSALQRAPRFRKEFAAAYRRVAEEGPIAAMQHAMELT